jgi:lipoyl(octanoyl) transferase
VHELQRKLFDLRRADGVTDVVLLVEHDWVVTLGAGAEEAHLRVPAEVLAARGIDVETVGRGGDVTLHGPGQLVVYPILALPAGRQDVRRYVGDLAETMRRLCAQYGIAAGTVPHLVGLWTDTENPSRWEGPARARRLAKIGAIGVRISRWTTMHGFALNLTTDLSYFELIVPCGIREHGVTSVQQLTGFTPSVFDAAQAVAPILNQVWGLDAAPCCDLSHVAAEDLLHAHGLHPAFTEVSRRSR